MDGRATARATLNVPKVSVQDIRGAVRQLDLSKKVLCVHSSLRSFGHIRGGASALVRALLAEQCTLLVPTFSWGFGVPPPADRRPARNAWDYASEGPVVGLGRVYTTETTEISGGAMGAVSATVVRMPERERGNHPLNSFSAVGPRALELVCGQSPRSVYAPLRALAELDGWVVLMGVGLESMTLLHLAEQQAGRTLFRRWANGPDEQSMDVEVGSCSRGFGHFEPLLSPLKRELCVGHSLWQAFPVKAVLETATRAIRADPRLTHCGRPGCRCDDAVAGGPLLHRPDNEGT